MSKSMSRLALLAAVFLIAAALAYSTRQPNVDGDNNAWGNILNAYLNVSLDENGSINRATNASISLWNASGSNIFLREISANVGIGTLSPAEKLTVIGNVNISGYLNISGNLIVNNQFNVTAANGNVNVAGTLDAAGLRILGSIVQVEADSYKNSNLTSFFGDSGINGSILRAGNHSNLFAAAFAVSNYSAEYAGTGYKKGNLSSDLSGGAAATIVTTSLTTDTMVANKNIYVIGNISNLNIANLNINGSMHPSMDDTFSMGNATLRWKNANFSGTLYGSTLDGASVRAAGRDVQVEAESFKLSNFTTAYDNRADRFGLSNYSAEYASTGFKRANVSDYLGGTDINASLIKVTNTTFFSVFSRIADAFSKANLTDFFGDSSFNSSVLRVGNISGILGAGFNLANYSAEYSNTGFKLGNLTTFFGDASFNSSVLRAGNISSIVKDQWTRANTTDFLGGAGANDSLVRASNLSSVVRTSDGFTLANYSSEYAGTGYKIVNFTDEYGRTGFKRANLSDYLGGSDINASLIKVTNTTFFNQFSRSGDFDIRNISNDTLRASANASIALWNVSGDFIRPRDTAWIIKIGNFTNVPNYANNTLSVLGSGAFYGSFNATFINASEIRIGSNPVQEEGTAYKIVNFTDEYGRTGWKRANITDFLGGSGANDSLVRASNLSTVVRTSDGFTLANYSAEYASTGFKLANYSSEYASTGYKLANFTSSFDSRINNSDINISNLSVSSITTRLADRILIIGSVNITGNLNLTGSIGATRFTGKIDCSKIDGGSDSDFCADTGGDASAFNLANYSTEYASTGFKLANYSSEYASTGYKLANFTSNLQTQNASLWNRSSTNIYPRFIGDNVGIGTTGPQNKLEVVGAATLAGGVNASSLNVTGFSITDDSLVTVVEFEEESKEVKSLKLEEYFRNDNLTDFTEAVMHNKYINLSIHSDNDATDAQNETFSSLRSENKLLPPTPTAVYQTAVRNDNRVQIWSNLNENPGGGVSQFNSNYKIKKVKIKDITAGQYVLSLDEATGKLVPRKVNALLDHGIKPIYEMATEEGRAINTTAEHPYFVKFSNLESNKSRISSVLNTLTLDCFLNNFSSDQIAPSKANARAKYCTSLLCGANFSASSAYMLNSLSGRKSTSSFMNRNIFTSSSDESLLLSRISSKCFPISKNRYSGEASSSALTILFSRNTLNALPFDNNEEKTLLQSTTTSIKDHSFKDCLNLCAKDSSTFSDNSATSSSVSLLLDAMDFNSSSLSSFCLISFLTTTDQFTLNSSISCFNSIGKGTFNSNSDILTPPNDNNANDYLKLSNRLGEWIEVRYLKAGDEIAVPDYSTGAIRWEKIASIKTLEPQHVYDLSIEGTRNFIANDIVAHNTYLATSSGKVGINTTSPSQTLHVVGTLNVSGSARAGDLFVDTSGNVGIGTTSPASLLQVAGTFNATSSSTQMLLNSNGDIIIDLRG